MSLLDKSATIATKLSNLFAGSLGHASTNTSDAGESGTTIRSPQPTQLPSTASDTDPTASPPPQRQRPVPPSFDLASSDTRSVKKRHIAREENKDGGLDTYKPIPVPDPLFWAPGYGYNMPKPGANHSFKPIAPVKVYTNKGKPREISNTHDRHTLPPFPYGDNREAKRRKVDCQAIEVDSGDTLWDVAHSSPARHAARSDRRSVASGHSAGTRPGLQSPDEFEATNAIVNPRWKRRTVPPGNTSTASSLGRRGFGHNESFPIVLDDEADSGKASTARRLQLQTFEQGIPSKANRNAKARGESTVSKLFAQAEANIPKRRHDQPGLMHLDESHDIRNKFKRHFQSDPITSEDELAVDAKETTRKPKATTKHGPTNPLSLYKRIENLPSTGWELQLARTHGHEESGPGLSLMKGDKEQNWRVVGTDNGARRTKIHLSLCNINKAETDCLSRVRLLGPQDANNDRYEFHLQFANQESLQAFQNACIKPEVKLTEKLEGYMKAIFEKPIVSRRGGLPTISSTARSGTQVEPRKSHLPHKTSILDGLKGQTSTGDLVDGPRGAPSQNGPVRTSTRPARATRANPASYVELEPEPVKSLGYSVQHGLGRPWKKQLTYGSGRRRAVIDFNDLTRLDEEEFLNDSLIDFYMIYLFNHSKLPADKVYFFNTHFFSTLTRKVPGHKKGINYAGVARWTAKEDIFDYDYIVVPINQDLHWYLAIICNVRNIDRKLAIEVGEKPSAPLKVASETENVRTVKPNSIRSTSCDLPLKPSSDSDLSDQGPGQNTDDEMLFSEDSKLDLINPYATRENIERVAAPQNDPTEELIDANMSRSSENLIADAEPAGMPSHDAASSTLPKKAKRKSAPPVKRYDPEEPCIIIMDSLGNTSRSGAVRALKDYICEEGKAKRGMEAVINQNAFYPKGNQIPMQNNFSDCGVYVLGYIQQFFKDPDRFKSRLLGREMSAEIDWPDMSVTSMREDIRNILLNLHKFQNDEQKRAHAAQKAGNSSVPKDPTSTVTATVSEKTDTTKRVPETRQGFSTVATGGPEHPQSTSNVVERTSLPGTTSGHSNVEDMSESSILAVEETVLAAKPRLGSPFQARPTIKSNVNPPQHTVKPTSHVSYMPEMVHDDQTKSSGRSTRKFSPRVVIASKQSPTVSSSKRKHGEELPEVEILSPRKQNTAGARVNYPTSQDDTAVTHPPSRTKTILSPHVRSGVRGSPGDPIPIDDSQDTFEAPPAKQMVKKNVQCDSPESLEVMSPEPARDKHLRPRDRNHRPKPPTTTANKVELMIPDSPTERTGSPSASAVKILPL